MGKADNQRLPVVQQQSNGNGASRTFFNYRRCATGFYRISSVKCAAVLIFSLAAFLSALFWLLPIRHRQAGFDAKESIKLSATVQSYFKLEKPVSELVPYIARLEYDINEEIGVPSSKVAVLSMHRADLPNRTYVVFGFVPDPINSTISTISLSLLKSSLIDIFLQQYNLSLTSEIFGEPSSFETLKFPGGITVMPEQTNLISQPLLNFTLNSSSIYDIKQNLVELKAQLGLGLRLIPNEVVYVQVTNKHGSTKDPPVIVEASVASDLGTILPERLLQLAQIITQSPTKDNLGLDHSVFGKVKEISLSSFLNHSLCAPPPAPTPTPSPSYSPAFAPESPYSLSPCSNCYTSEPPDASPPSTKAPSPSPISQSGKISPNLSPRISPESPQAVLTPRISPRHSPFPGATHVMSSSVNTHSCNRHMEDSMV
ncbi:hypothetical protein CASFOL_035781 [Castilleja foliolosa]|uniref:DUF7036 domain-containing protein n=1 Tax=Castilleja foliolosa TaxID=1961234 RepID=A0ABD3BUI0_9LAMI